MTKRPKYCIICNMKILDENYGFSKKKRGKIFYFHKRCFEKEQEKLKKRGENL